MPEALKRLGRLGTLLPVCKAIWKKLWKRHLPNCPGKEKLELKAGANSKGSKRCQRRNKGIEGPCQQNLLCGQQQKVKEQQVIWKSHKRHLEKCQWQPSFGKGICKAFGKVPLEWPWDNGMGHLWKRMWLCCSIPNMGRHVQKTDNFGYRLKKMYGCWIKGWVGTCSGRVLANDHCI